ncbi:KilA-N domain-containing protein [Staphylococcus xylosus]|uniref:KilA-N domain-containing protein n=2 Tax=Staphylococcus xylosus TaxID=1288 RepID=A0A5R9B2F2_STAXY|nr:KilA-N domain-containing protein [Staphylococcus xylosus]MEB6299216.1 KilA-N domain-containing protein [Staphylococcus xylosus]MEB6320716.1 KilA-N domain-containing protein [Staphylococcus xylosus]MEB7756593.1 KilA-N domain-containing protein [Staphylococcus xylosus]MEB7798711.1 KilA-N domain-containing protein [Staphylococcus xylosus]TLP90048.1 KilA-N domain-containing protein [Staphylococcus xylosus]
MDKINAIGQQITLFKNENDDYISLTDIAKYKSEDPNDVIKNWLRSKDTIEFLGVWENINNPNFKPVEFDGFRNQAGRNAFTMSPTKWINTTNAIGLITKSGRYGGTFAQKDIAFEFASWISAEFKLYIIQDYQRLKEREGDPEKLNWDLKRLLSKTNYSIHTDAIKDNLINSKLSQQQIGYTYANEADVLNVAIFGLSAKQWKENNPDKKGNQRDYATIEELIVISNLESRNAELIEKGIEQSSRLKILNELARKQMRSLLNSRTLNNSRNQKFLE